MAARLSKAQLIGIVEGMAEDVDGRPTDRIKAIEFLLEHNDESSGEVQQVWDELFLVGELDE